MHGQGSLDLGDFEALPSRDALIEGVRATLARLGELGVLDSRHAGLVQLLRAEANDYAFAHGIARTNYARLIGDHLTALLELAATAADGQDGTNGEDGDRVTQLSAFLRAESEAPGATDVRDAATA